MLSLNFSLLIIVASLSIVHAARYCQCENPTYYRIFPGIQSICSELSSGWCATNCNIIGNNCDYCQWTPAGAEPAADYAKLKSWCFQQEGYDSGRQQSYHGTEVNCYSYDNKARCSTCGGCAYSQTSFHKRDLLDEVLAKRQGSDEDPDSAPQSSVLLEEEGLFGDNEGGTACMNLFPGAVEDIKTQFISKHPDCCATEPGNNGYSLALRCGSLLDDVQVIVTGLLNGKLSCQRRTEDFSDLCAQYGGEEDAVDAQGNPIDPESPS